MRILLLPILLMVLCAAPLGGVEGAEEKVFANQSALVAALAHFRSLADLWLPKASVPNGVLLVNRHFMTSKGFLSASQMHSDLSRAGWSVPEEARLDMERRADAHEAFDVSGLPAFIRVLDFGNGLEIPEGNPDAKCSIKLWAPGYTKDGRQAVVRFLFGPTTHGASAVYLLELREGLWRVIRHKVSYYA